MSPSTCRACPTSGTLAIPPSGVGYAVACPFRLSFADGNKLWSLNLSTGAATQHRVAEPQRESTGLAANAAGTLYGWAALAGAPNAAPWSPSTRPTARSRRSARAPGNIQSLAFSPSGVLYGARDQLYSISTATGATTAVGAGGYGDVRGIEFMTDPVPPATVSFLPGNGVVAPGGFLAVAYHAPGHGGETFAPVPSCTLGTFSAPFLPQPRSASRGTSAPTSTSTLRARCPCCRSPDRLPRSPARSTRRGTRSASSCLPASFPPGLNIPDLHHVRHLDAVEFLHGRRRGNGLLY